MKYKDLSEKEKEFFRAYYAENMLPDEWWDCVYDSFKEHHADKGFTINNIEFSGFWSQGDGASWIGRVDRTAFIQHYVTEQDSNFSAYQLLRGLIQDSWVSDDTIIDTLNYHSRSAHEGKMYVPSDYDQPPLAIEDFNNYYDDSDPVIQKGLFAGTLVRDILGAADLEQALVDLNEHILRVAKDIARDLYRDLEKEYEWLTSDEYIEELADINDWEFAEGGRLI